jgi:glycosyltransferase involved in cell wall biosynthesis
LATLKDRAWRLRVVGRGTDESLLRDQAATLGIGNRVEFLGYVPNRSVPALYQASAVVVVPSIRTAAVTEVWSLVVNEAMQAGALVVASDCIGAVQDGLVGDGYSGVTFPSGEVMSLADRLATVTDPTMYERMRRMAAVGQEEVLNYSFAKAANAFVVAARLAQDARVADDIARRMSDR